MKFYKMCSLNNDFVIVDYDEAQKYLDSNFKISSLAECLAHRKYGVGCDQVIFYQKSNEKISAWFYNQDGGEAEMCGNGLCALGRLFYKLFDMTNFFVRTKNRSVEISASENNVEVNINQPSFDAEKIIIDADEDHAIKMIKQKFRSVFSDDCDEKYHLDCECDDLCECCCSSEDDCHCEEECICGDDCHCAEDSDEAEQIFNKVFNEGIVFVSVGNPHVVLLSSSCEEYVPEELFEQLAPKLEKLSCFKNKANIGFANIIDDAIYLRVWERGAGDTGACGSGACAAVAAAQKLGINVQHVYQHGGDADVYINSDDELILRSNAEIIFTGEFNA